MKNKWLFGGIGLILISGIGYAGYFQFSSDSQASSQKISQSSQSKKVYEHIFPKQIEENNYFQGEFIANDSVSIFPRRTGIIQDIYVDIGDTVQKGDVLARLFQPGVVGESNAKIAIDQTKLNTNKRLLIEEKKVHDYEINEINQKILEKEKVLTQLEKKYASELVYIGDSDSQTGEFGVEFKELKKIQTNISNMEQTQQAQREDAQNTVQQKKEILEIQLEDAYLQLFPIIYIGNQSDIDYQRLSKNDISELFGGKNNSLKNTFLANFQNFIDNYEKISIEEKYNFLLDFHSDMTLLLRNTIVSVDIPESQIRQYISQVTTNKTALTRVYQNYIDAKNQLHTLEKSLSETYENLLHQRDKVQQKLDSLTSKYRLIDDQKKLELQKILSEIENLKQSKNRLIGEQRKEIIQLENAISVSVSQLREKTITQGDYTIISPFSGVVSKRDAEVGKNISQNTEIFRLIGVETTLAKRTKKEVKFHVPQDLIGELSNGQEIYFTTGNNQEKSFTGVIHRIGGEIDSTNFTVPVQAKVSDGITLAHKSVVKVELKDTKDYYEIPSSAIYEYQGKNIVYYKKENGKFGRKTVTIISDQGEFSLVGGNINQNTKIIITPIFIK